MALQAYGRQTRIKELAAERAGDWVWVLGLTLRSVIETTVLLPSSRSFLERLSSESARHSQGPQRTLSVTLVDWACLRPLSSIRCVDLFSSQHTSQQQCILSSSSCARNSPEVEERQYLELFQAPTFAHHLGCVVTNRWSASDRLGPETSSPTFVESHWPQYCPSVSSPKHNGRRLVLSH